MEDIKFEGLEPLSNPISVPQEEIHVEITDSNLFDGFAKAFITEATRVNPLKMEQVRLSQEEVASYINFLVEQRVLACQGKCTLWRQLKLLCIPSWVQYNLRMIGNVTLRDLGLRITPVFSKEVISYDEALEISNRIDAFSDDLQIVKDAMPRGDEGDSEVMSTALIAGYVRSLAKLSTPIKAYVTAFMGMKIKEEAAMKVLYRIQYDDLVYIQNAILSQRSIFK